MKNHGNGTGKNIVICFDGTGNEFNEELTNIVKIYRMLERAPGRQVTYYDPGVGTIGDQTLKTKIAKWFNKTLGSAFGKGIIHNVLEAYEFLMNQYNDGDKVFIFGFSRGAYTARALAAFIKECGLFEQGASNLFPYAIKLFLAKAPKEGEAKTNFFKLRSSFRSTYGRLVNRDGDPRDPSNKEPNYQLRIHFLGLFDTVKSYGSIGNPVILRNEEENPSVLNVRHAISIDEKRAFFPQMHWKATKKFQTCKEVWFAGVHSDVGGGYAESKSGLAKISLEWMVHEAISMGLIVNTKRYGMALRKEKQGEKWINLPHHMEGDQIKYAAPDPKAEANKSLKGGWKFLQLFPKKLEHWQKSKGIRTIKNQHDRLETEKELNPFLIHESVIERLSDPKIGYKPKNLLLEIGKNINNIAEEKIEKTISSEEAFANHGSFGTLE